jgi:hypothetical protein
VTTRLPQIAAWLAGAALLAVGCFNPNIAPGGFRCADGGVCPQNFHCAVDNKCYSANTGPDSGAMCESKPPSPLCSTEPASGQACDPACQTGCACGWCDIVSGAASCSTTTQGTKSLGQVCDPTAASSECAPGYFCQAECGKVGRCYRVCSGDGDCNAAASGTSTCSSTANSSGFGLCTLPACDPFKVTGSGCPSGSACYAFSQTFCACAGTKAPGATCVNTADCQPGYTCVGSSSGSYCAQLCDPANPVCDADGGSASCSTLGSPSFGYCM